MAPLHFLLAYLALGFVAMVAFERYQRSQEGTPIEGTDALVIHAVILMGWPIGLLALAFGLLSRVATWLARLGVRR